MVMMRLLAASALLASSGVVLTTQASESSLRQVIVLSRHGIRGPYGLNTDDPEEDDISQYIQNANFTFPYNGSEWGTLWDDDATNSSVSPKLTHHGYKNIEHMGAYFGNYLYKDFLSTTTCNQTFAYADDSQRDNMTAIGFLAGMAPSCGDYVPVTDDVALLFDQGGDVINTKCPVASEEVYEGIVGSNTSQYVLQEVLSEVQTVNDLLDCCKASVCYGNDTTVGDETCDLFGIESEWSGAYWQPWIDTLSTADFFSEVLLSIGLNNMTMPESSLTLEKIVALSRVHDIHIQLVSNQANAASFGGTLLSHLAASFEQRVTGRSIYVAEGEGPQLAQSPDNRFLYYAAHDINLVFVRNMLGLEWFTKGWHPQQPVVGGMLVFELHSASDDDNEDDYYVQLYFMSATPEQMRNLDDLTPENPPDRASVNIPLCSVEVELENGETELRCPFSAFKQLLGKTLRHECVADTMRPFTDSLGFLEDVSAIEAVGERAFAGALYNETS